MNTRFYNLSPLFKCDLLGNNIKSSLPCPTAKDIAFIYITVDIRDLRLATANSYAWNTIGD